MEPKRDITKEEKAELIYRLMAELEQLECLTEDMHELGVTSLAEAEDRIAEINAQLDLMD